MEATAGREEKFPLAIKVEPAHAAPSSPWVIRGRVRTALAVSVSAVDLGRMPPASILKPRVIAVRALTGLSHLEVKKGNDAVTAALIPTADPAHWELIVGRATQLPAGRYITEIHLCPVTRTGESPPSIRIPVEFDILGDVQPDSSAVVLGSRRVGEVAEGQLTLTSLSGRPFCVTGMIAEPSDNLEVLPDEPGEASQSFAIRQRVTKNGDTPGSLRLNGQDADGKPFEVVVEVKCFGVNPQ